MDERVLDYFELTKDNSVIVKENRYAEAHIPIAQIEDKDVELAGDTAVLFGQMDFYVWRSSYTDDLKLADAKKIAFRLPNTIYTHPGRIKEDKDLGVYIFQYHHGDQIVVTTQIEKTAATVILLFKKVISGYIADDIPYDQIPYLIEECARINNYDLGANILFIDLICSVVARNPHNNLQQFREYLNSKKGVSMLDRKLVNIDKLPALTSQFGALSGAYAKLGITTTIGAIKTGEMEQEEIDIEKVI